MNLKIVYPIPIRQQRIYRILRSSARIFFLAAALICLLVNYLTKGKPWSIIVVWSLFSIWRLVFSLRLVEFSMYSHAIKVTFYLVVLLGLIDHFLAPGWAQTVIPIVLFAYLLVMIIIFFVTYDRKEKHLVSIMLLGLLSIATIPYSLHSLPITNWLAFAFHCASLVLFITMLFINRKDVFYELKVRFIAKEKKKQ